MANRGTNCLCGENPALDLVDETRGVSFAQETALRSEDGCESKNPSTVHVETLMEQVRRSGTSLDGAFFHLYKGELDVIVILVNVLGHMFVSFRLVELDGVS